MEWSWSSLIEKVPFAQRLEGNEGVNIIDSRGRAFQKEGTFCVNTLRQLCIWYVKGIARRPMWLEWVSRRECNRI